MDFDRVLFMLGQRPVTLADIVVAGAIAAFLLLILATALVWRMSRARQADFIDQYRRTADLEFRIAELSGSLQGFAAQTQGGQANLQRAIDERLDSVSQRVGLGLHEQAQRTTQSLSALNERLAVIDAAQANLASLSGEMLSLKDILANKQTRGAFGQGRMEAIIRDGLHARAFEFQATLSNGTRPDCVITLPDSDLRLVIDAKFPLEAWNAMRHANDETVRKQAEAQFRSDILRHVKDISDKYHIGGETHDTAIMFVPSESIYADVNERFEDVVQRAHRVRVIFASPNVLLLLVQTMQAIVKDSMMRDQAHIIKGEVVKLLEDVVRLKERTADLKRHFEQAGGDIDKIAVSADRISKRGLRIESLDLEENTTALDNGGQPRPKLVNSG
jgi:DNA recombination protein RmuC